MAGTTGPLHRFGFFFLQGIVTGVNFMERLGVNVGLFRGEFQFFQQALASQSSGTSVRLAP